MMQPPQALTAYEVEEAFKMEARERCSVGKILDGLDPEVRAVMVEKLAAVETYSGATIARVIKNLGLGVVSREKVGQHRKGDCRCTGD